MELKKGWLDRQFASVAKEVEQWPEWLQSEAGNKRVRGQQAVNVTVRSVRRTAKKQTIKTQTAAG
jgi:hypothetical protein